MPDHLIFGGCKMCKVKQVAILLCVLNLPTVVFALGMEDFGDKPIEPSADWPVGTLAMAASQGRVYSRWVNGGEYFCYKGDINAFNDALKKFAAIEAPAHQLTIEYGYGKTESFDGKKIQFDWRLDVTGGISRSVMLEKGATEKQLAPKLTYYLGRDEKQLEALILPENIEVTCLAANDNWLLEYHLKQALKWQTAKLKWAEFAGPFLANQREQLKKTWPSNEPPLAGYVEFQSRLVSKYLPDYKIYVIETTIAGSSKLFAVSSTGEISDLKGSEFVSMDGNSPFKNEQFSKFIAARQIHIPDVNTAIEVGRFIEELVSAPDRWMYLRYNSNDFRIFKAWIFSGQGTVEDPNWQWPNWQWYAEKYEAGWIVSRNYVGPPASIIAPPRWKLVLDEQKRIIEVMHSSF